jgi:hypothetical protein
MAYKKIQKSGGSKSVAPKKPSAAKMPKKMPGKKSR